MIFGCNHFPRIQNKNIKSFYKGLITNLIITFLCSGTLLLFNVSYLEIQDKFIIYS